MSRYEGARLVILVIVDQEEYEAAVSLMGEAPSQRACTATSWRAGWEGVRSPGAAVPGGYVRRWLDERDTPQERLVTGRTGQGPHPG